MGSVGTSLFAISLIGLFTPLAPLAIVGLFAAMVVFALSLLATGDVPNHPQIDFDFSTNPATYQTNDEETFEDVLDWFGL